MVNLTRLAIGAIFVLLPLVSFANEHQSVGIISLSYSNGAPQTTGLDEINKVLRSVGVHVSAVELPQEGKAILKVSQSRAINPEETVELLSLFSLHRGQLLDIVKEAGRVPEAHRGGYLSTSEVDVPPYPKVYDMKAMTPEVKAFLQEKFGKLHVNSADNGTGIDEVMTIVSGGPWTWFFLLPENVIGKLSLGFVGLDGPGWRISYPGLGPHGGFLDSEHGLVVAHAHGPEQFVMRYVEPSIQGANMLGTNTWIDFSGETPKLLE